MTHNQMLYTKDKMSKGQHNIAISNHRIVNQTNIGFGLLVDDREYFVPFADYPVFKGATVGQIYAVEKLSPTQFHWPELDTDIELEALAHPKKYSLVFHE